MAALTDVAIAQAMVANGRWSARLGWDRYVDAIDVLLGAAPGIPAAAAVFSSALADWQAAHQLDVDGILGPETWAAMRRALAPPASLTGVVRATECDQDLGRNLRVPRDPWRDPPLRARLWRGHRPQRRHESPRRARGHESRRHRRVPTLWLPVGRGLPRAQGSHALPVRDRVLTDLGIAMSKKRLI